MTVLSSGAVKVSLNVSMFYQDLVLTPGTGFSGSAEDISFDIEGADGVPVLRAMLNPVDGDPVEANVNLAECIGNDCGTLVFGKFIWI